MKGWHNNSYGHKLASKGVKSKQFKTSGEYNYLKEPFDSYVLREAKEYFGIANEIQKAGFILPNDEMLDFSKKSKGVKGSGHDNIEEIGVTSREFIDLGAVRVTISPSNECFYFSFYKPLTNSQKRTLARVIREYQPVIFVDIIQDSNWDEKLNNYYLPTKSLEFGMGTYAGTMFREIEEAMI